MARVRDVHAVLRTRRIQKDYCLLIRASVVSVPPRCALDFTLKKLLVARLSLYGDKNIPLYKTVEIFPTSRSYTFVRYSFSSSFVIYKGGTDVPQ